jgi:hypothetical protein
MIAPTLSRAASRQRAETVTSVVSKIGTTSTRSGPITIGRMLVDAWLSPCGELSVSVATLKPMNSAPLSPMKIDAG